MAIQLQLRLHLEGDDDVPLGQEGERTMGSRAAILLLQILAVETGEEEVQDDPGS